MGLTDITERERSDRRRRRQRGPVREPPEVEPRRARLGGDRWNRDLDVGQRQGDARVSQPTSSSGGRRSSSSTPTTGPWRSSGSPPPSTTSTRSIRSRSASRAPTAPGSTPRSLADRCWTSTGQCGAHDQPSRRPLATGRARGAAVRASASSARSPTPRRRASTGVTSTGSASTSTTAGARSRGCRRRRHSGSVGGRSSTPTTEAIFAADRAAAPRSNRRAAARVPGAAAERRGAVGFACAPRCSTTRTANPTGAIGAIEDITDRKQSAAGDEPPHRDLRGHL